ncbi:hypothetical protein AL485_02615 [Serratia liquefaciens]|uniref:hypothetical protein n=1 Tax=Serratia liquefaciens TaxID=614 RepID=UPI0006611369|nr:hypothetical protein [Serratia liquefaciens]AMG98146.1 hypothetical protein AL485_02615 [Serratia liquefaciens]
MAIPIEIITERVLYLESIYKKYSVEELESLKHEDLEMFGAYIQTYGFIDLNIQRVYVLLKEQGVIKLDKKEMENTPFMLNKLIEKVDDYIESPDRRVVAKNNLEEIKLRRPNRNIFAHWGARRIPGEDGFVFMTCDPFEYRKMFSEKITTGDILYSIQDAADLRELTIHIRKYDEWIAILFKELTLKYGAS